MSQSVSPWNVRCTSDVHRIGALHGPFLGRDTLVRNERATGRYKNLGDLEAAGDDPRPEG